MDQVWYQVQDQVRTQVRTQVWNQVRGPVWYEAYSLMYPNDWKLEGSFHWSTRHLL